MMVKLFFTGQDNYFPGIWIKHGDDNLDQCPIYVCDIASDNEPIYIGNFKRYMTIIIKDMINNKENLEIPDDMLTQSETSEMLYSALKELNKFSDNVLDYGEVLTREKLEKKIIFSSHH